MPEYAIFMHVNSLDLVSTYELAHYVLVITAYGLRREKTCLRWFANDNGADQPAHPCSLISAFVICLLESVIFKPAIGQISLF